MSASLCVDKLKDLVLRFVWVLVLVETQVLIYDTENRENIDKFDCVYHTTLDGDEIPYCQRSRNTLTLDRSRMTCDNDAEKICFRDLIDQYVHPNNVLRWSSSIDMADLYARIYYTRSLLIHYREEFICNCTAKGTFGRYCEYRLTHNSGLFSGSVENQFLQKRLGDSWNTQRYGKILCYETLPCNTGDFCLDWREIGDGFQRCSSGIDEENWDKLEFNECEDDEFRCLNGMCIAEEFWLDGNFDCMDWSDELFFNYGEFCSLTANTFECDEHLCYQGWYSCGDGQCIIFVSHIVFQRVVPAYQNCFNKRNLNYMCEANAHEPSWTLDDGLCWTGETYDDPRYSPWNSIDSANMTEERKCEYLVRCLLSNGLEFDCPCNRENCSLVVKDECKKKGGFVQYPPEGLISGNMRFFYDPTDSSNSNAINRLELGGRVRCRGFHLTTSEYYEYPFHYIIAGGLRINTFLCALDSEIHMEKDHESPFQFDKFCWNNSLTFNGRPYAVYPDTCEAGDICISQYRIRDGYGDCVNGEDEKNVFGKSFCLPQVGRHRFQCYDDENKCLPNFYLGTGLRKCSNNYDKVWYGVGVSLQETRRCRKEFSSDCLILQEYIRQSSIKDFRQNISDVNRTQRVSTNQMAFQFYCNSFWELGDSKDEDPVLCEKWICRKDQYKCRNGQCIPLDWLCDGEWDCADASDEEAIELIDIWSTHNQRLHGLSERRELCRKRYSKSPFSTICNTSFEFGCFLSGVEDPLSIRLKRPCINLAKIGDGHEDCYNGYDEKNVFKTDSGYAGMWGFNFRCENQTVLHSLACSVAYDRCNRVLCANRRSTNGLCPGISDAWCLEENRCVRNGRCNGIPECFHGEDEYWCPRDPMNIHSFYRTDKLARWKSFKFDFHLPYPQLNITKEKQSQHKDVIMSTEMFPVHHSYICNRGITILVLNEERCLCPPAFYGKRCEFFNDRITVIAILDRKILPKTNRKTILKIKAILFFNNLVIDFDEFLVNPTFESAKRIKHRFYLLYSRSNRMLEHKRWRYFNRTDIIEYHPYSVHFVAFALTDEREIAELGSWIYTIYFDYIPAFRLAIVLKFPYWFDNQALDLCQNSSCTANSVCKPIFNGNRTHYCSCKNGYYGENCQFYESRCQISCSSNAFCQIFYDHHRLNRTKIHCICPLDHFGRGCFLKNDNCEPNPCLNDGACFSTYSRSGENPFICRCSEKFYGQRCEQPKAKVRVRLEAPMLSAVKATAVQLLNVKTGTWTLVIEYQEFHLGLLSMVNYFHSDMSAPSIGLLKTLDDRHQVEVLVLYVLRQDNIDIGSVPSRCVSIPSQIAENTNGSILSVTQYHQFCVNATELVCFYDDIYFCFCETYYRRAECFLHRVEVHECRHCLSGGKCLPGDGNFSYNFICACSSCHEGDRCELNLEPFGFTLDSLLLDFSLQRKIIYQIFVYLLVGFGLFNNHCSFLTFRRSSPRIFGTGTYLLSVACLNQMALICILGKFVEISFGLHNRFSCKTIPYLLSVFTRSTYWLNSWISVNRCLVIFLPVSPIVRSSRIAVVISFLTVFLVLGMHVHELLCYIKIERSSGAVLCVTDFQSQFIATYNRTSTVFHYLVPFIIQTVTVTILIVFAARSRARVGDRNKSFFKVMKKQFDTQKELYITPTIILISALPIIILAFSLACVKLTDWQTHMLLVAYLLSYAPQVLGFVLYVLASTSYKREFCETSFGKSFKRFLLKETRERSISKRKTATAKI